MAKKSLSGLNIDLLHPQGAQSTFLPQATHWLLTTGRYIIIIVEILVILAFVSRFKLDSDLADLQDKIKQQAPYIESLKNQEIIIRLTQFELGTVKQTKADAPSYVDILNKIATITPATTRLTNLNFDRTQSYPTTNITISGQASSNLELTAFLKALQNDSTFKDMTLSNLSYDRQNILFTITGTFAAGGTKN